MMLFVFFSALLNLIFCFGLFRLVGEKKDETAATRFRQTHQMFEAPFISKYFCKHVRGI